MKKVVCLILATVLASIVNAQDILVKKSGEIEKVKILEIHPTQIKYVLYDAQDGPSIFIDRADVFSIKFENDAIQILDNTNESKTSESKEIPSFYNKKWQHAVSVGFGSGWEIGYSLRRNINQYFTLDLFSLSYTGPYVNADKLGVVSFRFIGVRGYSPLFCNMRGYTNLDVGYTMEWLGGGYGTLHGFGLDFGLGIQIHKHFAVGYNLNYRTQVAFDLIHTAKITYLF